MLTPSRALGETPANADAGTQASPIVPLSAVSDATTSFPPLTQPSLESTGDSYSYQDHLRAIPSSETTLSFPLAQYTAIDTPTASGGDATNRPVSLSNGDGYISEELLAEDECAQTQAAALDQDLVDEVEESKAGETDALSFDDFEWEPKLIERHGKPIWTPVIATVRRNSPSDTKVAELRAFCCAKNIKGYKNKRKADLLSMIAQRMKNDGVYGRVFAAKMKERNEPASKQIQCPFRLINILFSSHFAARFVALCDQRTRADLDAAVSKEDSFWLDVLAAFLDTTPVEEYDNFYSTHPALDPASINPAIVVRHSVKQLRQIWASSHAAYRQANIRFTTSGTHDDDFFKFCGGRLDALYIHMHLQTKHELVGSVNRDLPSGVFCESTTDTTREPGSGSNQKRKSDVADAIREFGNQPWREALALRKQEVEEGKLRFLEQKEAHRVERMEQQFRREEKSATLKDFAFVSDRLRVLYAQQERESNTRICADIEEEIVILKTKKRKLADLL